MESADEPAGATPPVDGIATPVDTESLAWTTDLSASGPQRESAIVRLHDLLTRAARREGERRRGSLPARVAADLDDLARQAADDALVAVLRKLPGFRGQSRFTTWAFKFAVYEISVALRRETWRGRAISMADHDWATIIDRRPMSPTDEVEARELVAILERAVADTLTAHQREVFVAAVINDVPIDVLAERMDSTRNAIYKTVHDARARLRADLRANGWSETAVGRSPR